MSKQFNSIFISKIQKIIASIFLIGCLLTPFAPAIILTSNTISKTYGSTFVFLFGGDIVTKNITYKTRGISILGQISYFLIIVSLLLIIVSLFINKKKTNLNKWLILTSSIIILIGSIMLLCTHRSISNILADALISSHNDAISKTIFENTKLGFGIYGTSIFGFISSLFFLLSSIFDGSLKNYSKIRKIKN